MYYKRHLACFPSVLCSSLPKQIPTSITEFKEAFQKPPSELISSPTEINLSYTISHKQTVTATGGTRALLVCITCSKQLFCTIEVACFQEALCLFKSSRLWKEVKELYGHFTYKNTLLNKNQRFLQEHKLFPFFITKACLPTQLKFSLSRYRTPSDKKPPQTVVTSHFTSYRADSLCQMLASLTMIIIHCISSLKEKEI